MFFPSSRRNEGAERAPRPQNNTDIGSQDRASQSLANGVSHFVPHVEDSQLGRYFCDAALAHNFTDHLPEDIRESHIPAIVAKGKLLMIHSEEM